MNTIHRRPCLVFLYLGLGCERMFLKRQIFLETAHITVYIWVSAQVDILQVSIHGRD